MITVNSRKFDGTIRRSWQCELVEKHDSLLVFVGEFDADVQHSDLGRIQKGTVSYEYYWLDRWYNIFRFHEPSGELRNFYCNIGMPPKFENGVLDYIDLDIDVLAGPDLVPIVLDREDYERNAEVFDYPADLRDKVEYTLRELLEHFEDREIPGVPDFFATSHGGSRERR
jgi:protein associated with RNAse G/E